MRATTRARLETGAVAVAPAVLLAGFVYHPYISPPNDEAAVAAARHKPYIVVVTLRVTNPTAGSSSWTTRSG